MIIRTILDQLERWCPSWLSESWDKCGLQLGDPDAEIDGGLVCLDVDDAAASEAAAVHCGLIVSHHPLLFSPVQQIDESQPDGRLLAFLLRRRITVFSAHTNLDQIPGGVSDHLAAALGMEPTAPLLPPACAAGHDIPAGSGIGRLCIQDSPARVSEVCRRAERLPGFTGSFRNFEEDADVRRIAVMGGSFPDENLDDLVRLQVDLLVTGEIGYHDMLYLAARGIRVVAIGHGCSERVVLKPLAARLRTEFPGIRWHVREAVAKVCPVQTDAI
ncbi:MAG: Nif3-like dinuclear metal center hexameric protein [Clostridia bacterium]|nr:Nif3-like dinuclear metal center hexameric protein [Clostridia bacterium]